MGYIINIHYAEGTNVKGLLSFRYLIVILIVGSLTGAVSGGETTVPWTYDTVWVDDFSIDTSNLSNLDPLFANAES